MNLSIRQTSFGFLLVVVALIANTAFSYPKATPTEEYNVSCGGSYTVEGEYVNTKVVCDSNHVAPIYCHLLTLTDQYGMNKQHHFFVGAQRYVRNSHSVESFGRELIQSGRCTDILQHSEVIHFNLK